MVKIRTLVMTAMLAAVASPGFAQVDYDQMRAVQALVEDITDDTSSSWSIHDEEDSFTRETRRYVKGFGEHGLLFIVANCESLAVLFRNDVNPFANGKIESIWDDGDIVEHQFDDRDSMLVYSGTDWLRRLTEHDALRVRVTAYPESVVSDEFNLQETGMAVARDPVQAQTPEIDALRARAEAGDAEAQYDLGRIYELGEGAPQDDVEALHWYRLAADQGVVDAKYYKGRMEDNGRGRPDVEHLRVLFSEIGCAVE